MSATCRLLPVTSVSVIKPSKQSRNTVSQVSMASAIAASCSAVAEGCACTATVRSVWSHQYPIVVVQYLKPFSVGFGE